VDSITLSDSEVRENARPAAVLGALPRVVEAIDWAHNRALCGRIIGACRSARCEYRALPTIWKCWPVRGWRGLPWLARRCWRGGLALGGVGKP